MDPVLGIHLASLSMLAFLAAHLPLSGAQLATQNWQHGPLLHAIRERDAADMGSASAPRAHGSKDLLTRLSDWVLDRVLSGASSGRGSSRGALPQQEPPPGRCVGARR